MSAIKVNADYELTLFHSRSGPQIINQSLEFLAFFLAKEPLFTSKKYSASYFEHVESITGKRPQVTDSGKFSNWWGPLRDLPRERWMNSKVTSAELSLQHNWGEMKILKSLDELSGIEVNKPLLLKEAFGMSGQGLKAVRNQKDLLSASAFPCLLEPLRERRFDFSHYVFSDGRKIAYENKVDQRFQYRGTIFQDWKHPNIENLSFADRLDWQGFGTALEKIISHYSSQQLMSGFSIDSFVFEDQGKLFIQYLSEVNYRRTMGSCTYELASRFAGDLAWCALILGKQTGEYRLIDLPGVLHLSPHDVRFQMFFLMARNQEEGRALFNSLKKLLPECEFAIDI